VTGPGVGVLVGVGVGVLVTVGVGVIVGVLVGVSVGQIPPGHGVGLGVGVGLRVGVGVSVGVGVGARPRATTPFATDCTGMVSPLMRTNSMDVRTIKEIPGLLPMSLTVARSPEPVAPGGWSPSVTQVKRTEPACTLGPSQFTPRPVLPKKGPLVTDTKSSSAGSQASVKS
jgi:hypothetical protein